MDAATIRNFLAATLSADANVRRNAELQLTQAEKLPGFTDVICEILVGEQDSAVQLSAVIRLKSRVNKAWSGENVQPGPDFISEDEKHRLRERLLPILASSQPLVRNQLIPTIQRILHYDFPKAWPSFLDFTVQLLHTNDPASVLAGLQCLLAICRTYRFKANDGDNRTYFDKIVETSFPRLLAVCNELVNQESDEAGEMLHIALKAYKQATWLELSDYLRDRQTNIDWCRIFLQTVSKPIPASAMAEEDTQQREQHRWWKAKKWAYFNLNRLYIRHGNPQAIDSTNVTQKQFATQFAAEIAPEILKVYLQQIEKWVSKSIWLSRPCLSYTIVFMDECIRPKEMWTHLKDHVTNLVTHFIFPIMCLSPEDIENFEDEPKEFLHRKLNFYEEVSSPDVAATNFLNSLTKTRRKQTFGILSFINNVVTAYEQAPEGQKDYVAKEGALRMIATLAPVLLGKKSPIAGQVEDFLVKHVIPDFKSPQGFLRARACDTVEKFDQLEFKEPKDNLIIIYNNILECMTDPALPVRVTAALALQPLIRHDEIRARMQQNIPTIMQQLLKLSNEVDIDALANVMEDFVEVFAAELTPFAVALSEQLRDTYLRIVSSIIEEQQKKDGDDDEFVDYLDDKSITALGVLQTIGTLILTLESTPDVLLHIESVLMPVIEITLENKLYDLYNEVFEIIDSCTFAAKAISPTMWRAFELIVKTFKSGAELYLEDMLPALENFVQFGVPQLLQTPAYVEAMYGMVQDMFTVSKVGGVDRICACKLAETMMLSLPNQIDNCVTGFVSMAMQVLANQDVKIKSYKIHLMEMVINAIYYNPLLALHILESKGWTNKFFSLWFGSMDSFTRVHDKKLCIVAIVALLGLQHDQVPESIQVGWPRLLQGITQLFKTLPAAMKNREIAIKDDFTLDNSYSYDDEEEDDGWDDEDTNWSGEADQAGETAGDDQDGNNAYLEFLNQEAQKFTDNPSYEASDDELGEESVLLETPLDKLEPYQIFREALMKMQQEQPQFYQSLASHLSAEEQSVIQNAYNQAEALAIQAQQEAANAAAEGSG